MHISYIILLYKVIGDTRNAAATFPAASKNVRIALYGKPTSELYRTERHLPYGNTQCYLPPDTSECAVTPAMYSIYLPQRDGRLS